MIVPKYPQGKHILQLRRRHAPELGGGSRTQCRNQLLTQENCSQPKPNISLDEQKAIRELKEDRCRVVLTADKGAAMVVMDREDYMDKAQLLLADTNTYKPITEDLPTNYPKCLGTSKPREDSLTTFT